MRNLHAIEVRLLGATKRRVARIRIKSLRPAGTGVIIPLDYGLLDVREMGVNWLEFHGFDVVGVAELPHSYAVISTTFKKVEADA